MTMNGTVRLHIILCATCFRRGYSGAQAPLCDLCMQAFRIERLYNAHNDSGRLRMNDILSGTIAEKATALEGILLAACEGKRSEAHLYELLRAELIDDSTFKSLLPPFVRTCRNLDHFWTTVKDHSPHWAPRRQFVRDGFIPLFDYIEGKNSSPVDSVASDVLTAFDADGVQTMWAKALERRHRDAEGAITSARTLLETVCKRVLDEAHEVYDDTADLPALYKQVAKRLRLAPTDHTEETFKRILGGATSVVEGLGSLRNKIGDAHGKGGRPVKVSPRHAQLAVNLAGAMATFIVETWRERSEIT